MYEDNLLWVWNEWCAPDIDNIQHIPGEKPRELPTITVKCETHIAGVASLAAVEMVIRYIVIYVDIKP